MTLNVRIFVTWLCLWALSPICFEFLTFDYLFAMANNLVLSSLISILFVSLCTLVYFGSSIYIFGQQQVSSYNYYLSFHIDWG